MLEHGERAGTAICQEASCGQPASVNVDDRPDDLLEAPWSSYHFEATNEAGEVLLEFPSSEAIKVERQPS
jgi:hypothetical protein